MELEEIEGLTRKALPEWNGAHLSLALIDKGGSGRLFVRVSEPASGRSLIAMHYDLDRADNPRFASITDFLIRHGIAAPAILARREDLRLLWVEDLGETDLGNLAGTDWNDSRFPAYFSALRTVFPLHCLTEDAPPADLPELERPFDESLYQWEQTYFLTHYVERFHSPELTAELREHPSLTELARDLAGHRRSLVHRDFQSTNVMLRGGSSYLIDYQGLRWGLPEYDLASMIYDPYSEFTPAQTDDLINAYFGLKQEAGHGETREAYGKRLVQCAMQRLMQAMGAYGFLGEVKGKREFLSHIPTAKRRLLELSRKDGGLSILSERLG
ncbi:MAG: phosphotransferase [Verrucomicrobia bacterium]|jgi:aminoglycoside/choline kinase family phosphotransferase|nr:phosphotransferase [Verrucomicrobiota bacterium]